jgi:hypothetical protein
MPMTEIDLAAVHAERERIREAYLRPEDSRPPSSARGLHHFAVVARDVEETIRFYQEQCSVMCLRTDRARR